MNRSIGPMTRRDGLVCLMSAGLLLGGGAVCGATLADTGGNAPRPFTQEAFQAAQTSGKHILVETYATWCPICARQTQVLTKLRAEPKFRDLVTFTVDFDKQKDVMRSFNARMQSTLIVFRGTKEVSRSTGETQSEWIEDMLQ